MPAEERHTDSTAGTLVATLFLFEKQVQRLPDAASLLLIFFWQAGSCEAVPRLTRIFPRIVGALYHYPPEGHLQVLPVVSRSIIGCLLSVIVDIDGTGFDLCCVSSQFYMFESF